MPNKTEKNSTGTINTSYLPDFCNGDIFLRLLLVVELIAIVFALVSFGSGRLFVHIALISVVMLWVGLTVAAILCWFSHLGWLRNHKSATLIAISVALLMTLLTSLISLGFGSMLRFGPTAEDIGYTLFRNLSVVAILTGMALRYFYLQYESKMRQEVQAQARLQALQARIRPHFLFNSMNTIASLTHDQPDLAEQAIENLSDLFRASLAAEATTSATAGHARASRSSACSTCTGRRPQTSRQTAGTSPPRSARSLSGAVQTSSPVAMYPSRWMDVI